MTDWLSLGLLVGPDKEHTIQLSIKTPAELLNLLQLTWRAVYVDNTPETDLGARVEQAVASWNALWGGDEEKRSPELWQWQGIALGGQAADNTMRVNWNLDILDNPKMKIYVTEL